LRMTRCSLCNTVLREANLPEIDGADYAPREKIGFTFFWCDQCSRLYWNGSHGRRISERIEHELKG
jgi:uncharacterized protein with PIN domain